jgi:hypothetical protein
MWLEIQAECQGVGSPTSSTLSRAASPEVEESSASQALDVASLKAHVFTTIGILWEVALIPTPQVTPTGTSASRARIVASNLPGDSMMSTAELALNCDAMRYKYYRYSYIFVVDAVHELVVISNSDTILEAARRLRLAAAVDTA